MYVNEWFYPRGSLSRAEWESIVDSEIVGWKFTGIRIAHLHSGQSVELEALSLERIVLPLFGAFEVSYQLIDGQKGEQRLSGRQSVFDGPTDSLYLPTGCNAHISGAGRVAVVEAGTTETHPVTYTPHERVAIEMRGAGSASRQIHNFGTPGNLEASRLIACEIITPAGNWSSYPPHKHDENKPEIESQLEEIYYFEVAVERGIAIAEQADPIGYLRVYGSPAGEIDTLAEVRTGDIALVPFGWHGPCIAAPGYDLYYLNVMAGPGPERLWLISDDPAHAWVRETWKTQSIDPRLPYIKAETKARSTT
jgi:5-deoxy-glucuronate isomerase